MHSPSLPPSREKLKSHSLTCYRGGGAELRTPNSLSQSRTTLTDLRTAHAQSATLSAGPRLRSVLRITQLHLTFSTQVVNLLRSKARHRQEPATSPRRVEEQQGEAGPTPIKQIRAYGIHKKKMYGKLGHSYLPSSNCNLNHCPVCKMGCIGCSTCEVAPNAVLAQFLVSVCALVCAKETTDGSITNTIQFLDRQQASVIISAWLALSLQQFGCLLASAP